MALTKSQIVQLLSTNDKAVCRALVVLNNRQTHDEQRAEHTKYNNGRGFRPAHAKMGTSMADFYTRNGYLSPKQIAYWRRPMKDGNMRLAIYWAQLAEEAEKKAAIKAAPITTAKATPVPAATKEDDYAEEEHNWRAGQLKAAGKKVPKDSDEFNRSWVAHKNEFARRETLQEAFAFMNSPD